MNIETPARHFLPQDLKIKEWAQLEPYFVSLKERELNSIEDLKHWLKDRSELESIVSEDLAWRYINMTRDTENKELEQSYITFVSEIEPKIAPYQNDLNKKMMDSGFTASLEAESEAYHIYFRSIKKEIELYREENIPLFTELATLAQKYGTISGAMSVEVDGKELTLQQAAVHLKSTDRAKREEVFKKISARRLQDRETLDDLLDQLIKLRHQVAVNAGFKNFRDYMFAAMGRFDYTVDDCMDFHNAIASEVVPLMKDLQLERKAKLGYDSLRPWDGEVDIEGRQPLKPFNGGRELLDKGIACFNRLDPYFSDCLSTMDKMDQLDLESRKGKAPGGYNYPLAEIGVPFIFMNAAGTLRDVETLVHEGGHAIHSFLTRDLELNEFKNCPSEVAELASMSMELVSMDAWDEYFANADELTRAKIEQLQGVIKTLPWIATVDKFQHWLYTNHTHTADERREAWISIAKEFGTGVTDWTGYEDVFANNWQRQLHIYEVPFYYIEYGFAQLGAIGVWKNYVEDHKKGLQQYKDALSLGYTKTIPEIYSTAGVSFDFRNEYVKDLFDFVSSELRKLKG